VTVADVTNAFSTAAQEIQNLTIGLFSGASPVGNPLPPAGCSGICIVTDLATLASPGSNHASVSASLAAGTYHLILYSLLTGATGTGGYAGTITWSVGGGQNEVPLPGALLLMATALLGGAGAAKWRKGLSAA
jgi:hypothetical protein